MRETMTSRERVLLAFDHVETGRPPFSLGFGVNRPARLALMEHLGHRSLAQTDAYLASFDDIRAIHIPYIGPPGRCVSLPGGGSVDIWGVERRPVAYAAGGTYDEIARYPLQGAETAADLEAYEWPDPDWYDYGAIPAILKSVNPNGEYAVRLGNGNILESGWYLRGFERMFVDLAAEPDFAREILRRVAAFFIEYFDRALTAAKGGVDIAFTADDIAGQEGLLMSPAMWEAQIKPWHKLLNARLHGHGVKVLYHTDGAAQDAVEGMIDMGIDAWEALQLDAKGMDAAALKRQYGDRLCFHGGIGVQKLLPFGTPEQVREETYALMRTLGKNGGYIAAPAHAVQAGTPPANIVAMLETSRLSI